MRWWLWAALQAFSCQLGLRDAFRWYLLIAFRLLLFWCLLKYHFFLLGDHVTIEASFFKVQIALSAIALMLMWKKIKSIDGSVWACAEKLTYMELSAWRVVGIFFVFLLLFNWFGILIFLVYGLSDLMFQMTWPRRRHALELDWRSAQAYSAMHWAVWSKFHGSKFRSRNIFLCRILRNILVLQFFIQAREALSFSETLCALWDPSLQLLQTSKVIRDLQLLITYDFKFSIFF